MHTKLIVQAPSLTLASGITIPDSKLAREATELVRDTENSLLFNHSSRAFPWWLRSWWYKSATEHPYWGITRHLLSMASLARPQGEGACHAGEAGPGSGALQLGGCAALPDSRGAAVDVGRSSLLQDPGLQVQSGERGIASRAESAASAHAAD